MNNNEKAKTEAEWEYVTKLLEDSFDKFYLEDSTGLKLELIDSVPMENEEGLDVDEFGYKPGDAVLDYRVGTQFTCSVLKDDEE